LNAGKNPRNWNKTTVIDKNKIATGIPVVKESTFVSLVSGLAITNYS
jgi:hypothetical protein